MAAYKSFRFTLNYNASPLVLTYNPDEWSELGLKIARHKRYKAVWTSFATQKLTFKRQDDGAGYIKNAFDTDGFDFEMSILIEWFDMSDYTYKTFFNGVIDSDTYREADDNGDVEVSIIESSATKKLADREEINYDVLSTVTADGSTAAVIGNIPETLLFRPSDIYQNANDPEILPSFPTTDISFEKYINKELISNTFDSSALSVPQTSRLLFTNNSIADTNILFETHFGKIDNQANITVNIPNTVYGVVTYKFDFYYQINSDTPVQIALRLHSIYNPTGLPSITEYIDITPLIFDATIPAGGTLKFWVEGLFFFDGAGTSIISHYLPLLDLEILEKQILLNEKKIDSILLYEAFAKTMDNINGKIVYSEPLGRVDSSPDTYTQDGEYSYNSIQSGYMLRSFPLADKPFSINFKDFWQSISSIFALALSYDAALDRFEIIKEIDSYSDVKIATLDSVKDLEIYPAKDFIFNEVKVGYKDKVEYEENNGTQEYNGPAQFELPITAISGKRDLQSVYHGDGLGQTFAAYNNASSTGTADTKYDNITYITALRYVAGWRTEFDEEFSSVEGVYGADTRMNLKITPKRNLLRHAQIVTPLYKKPGTATVNFRKSETSIPLSTQLSTESSPVLELSDELKSNFLDSKVEPIFYKFEYPITPALLADIQANKNGYFEFPNRDGDILNGYIWDITMNNYNLNSEFILVKKAE